MLNNRPSEQSPIIGSTPAPVTVGPILTTAPIEPSTPVWPQSQLSYKENPEIRSVRKSVIILLIIQILIASIYFFRTTSAFVGYMNLDKAQRQARQTGVLGAGMTTAAFVLVYLLIFLIMVVKYWRIGIKICAWLGIIHLLIELALVILMILSVMFKHDQSHQISAGIVASSIVIIATALGLLLTILTVVFALSLARLIKTYKDGYVGI